MYIYIHIQWHLVYSGNCNVFPAFVPNILYDIQALAPLRNYQCAQSLYMPVRVWEK